MRLVADLNGIEEFGQERFAVFLLELGKFEFQSYGILRFVTADRVLI